MPGESNPGLVTAGYLPRADPADVIVRRSGLERICTVATGSPRRRGQLEKRWPGTEFRELRGNVETRLRKLAEGAADATVLAAAGLDRLGISSWPGLEFERLPIDEMVPAVAQAAIAVQCRAGEEVPWQAMMDRPTAESVGLERALQHRLGAGCQTAFAAHATPLQLHLWHANVGYRRFALDRFDFLHPATAAERYLLVFFAELRPSAAVA
jgi:hydroxymethylbilane synthase